MKRGLCSVVATLATVLVIGPGTAWPHASLVRSSPAARATLTELPERVDLWFNERVEPKFSRVSVLNDQDQVVDTGEMVVGPDDARKLSVRVLSVDSHVVEGQFQFTVRAVR